MFRVRGRTGNSANKVTRRLKSLIAAKHGNVSAGILGAGTYPDGTNIAQVGVWLEYGTTEKGEGGNGYHIPPRPFLRNTARKQRKEWRKLFLEGKRQGRSTEQVLKVIGARMAGDIRKAISNFTDPPNAPSTIAKKGKDSPLRDTGTLVNSISWEYTDDIRNRGVEHKRVGQ